MNVSAELINNTHAQANVTRTIDIYRITSKDVQDLNDQTTANGTSVTRTGTQINYQTAYLATVQEIWQFILVKKNETWSIVNATRISIKEVEKQT
jgi:predicted secreted Zn-dependent protease